MIWAGRLLDISWIRCFFVVFGAVCSSCAWILVSGSVAVERVATRPIICLGITHITCILEFVAVIIAMSWMQLSLRTIILQVCVVLCVMQRYG